MSYADFHATPAGKAVQGLLADPATIRRMEEVAAREIPPVREIDVALADRWRLSNTEKQYVGIMVRDALVPRGWQVAGQRRFGDGVQFASGSWYTRRRTALPPGLTPVRDRVATARKLVEGFSRNDYGVADYLRDKREDARREDDR